jgi:uncharacterized protein with GYD domain
MENIKESPARLDAARKVCGRYDAIVISEAPDDAIVAKASLSLGIRGNVRTETFRAFNEGEFRKIITELK